MHSIGARKLATPASGNRADSCHAVRRHDVARADGLESLADANGHCDMARCTDDQIDRVRYDLFVIWYARSLVQWSGSRVHGCVCARSCGDEWRGTHGLYFYCLLVDVRMTMLKVVVHAVKSKAISAVALMSILPIYVAIARGVVIFDVNEYWLRATTYLGLLLPSSPAGGNRFAVPGGLAAVR